MPLRVPQPAFVGLLEELMCSRRTAGAKCERAVMPSVTYFGWQGSRWAWLREMAAVT